MEFCAAQQALQLLAQRAVTSRGEDETRRILDHLQQTRGLTVGRLKMGTGLAEWKRQEITGARPHARRGGDWK